MGGMVNPVPTPSAAALDKPATLSDVAHAAGVSRWVAGRVLNGGQGNSRVGAAAAQRIREAAKTLHYYPNHAALLLRGQRSHTFGLLVASAGDPLRSLLVQYLDAEAVKLGCSVLIGNTIGNPAVGPNQFDRYVEEFARRGVHGIFVPFTTGFRATGGSSWHGIRIRSSTKIRACPARCTWPSIVKKRCGWPSAGCWSAAGDGSAWR